MLELERACKRYSTPGGAIQALEDVTMRVEAATIVAVFGPSGSGKTTLLLLAAGLLRADEGSVRFQGRDLAALPRPELLRHRRTQLGFVFQRFNLIAGLTATENVAMPLLVRGEERRCAQQRARAALADVGLGHVDARLPANLSGGEQQRVAIARALVGGPRLVLADEPTGNLDSETGEQVLELLSARARALGAATIVVTHDARVADHADQVLELRDGRLAGDQRTARIEASR